MELTGVDSRLLDTRRAFDSVAAEYDGPRGNNALIQRMRQQMWRTLTDLFPRGARLLDLGCGPGLDAVYLAANGYEVVATDWSPRMVEVARSRAAAAGLHIRAETLGIHELARLEGERFDGIYSNLGPMNCAPDLTAVARACAGLLEPGGRLVVSVMGRICPWEFVYYAVRGRWTRARIRSARGIVPVDLNRHTVWTAYHTPREFFRAFAGEFELTTYRALGLFLPPPYLIRVYERCPRLCALLGWLDDRLGGLPLVRDGGDHFLMILTRRPRRMASERPASPRSPSPERLPVS
jgi:SAM-dependent methyltransferase